MVCKQFKLHSYVLHFPSLSTDSCSFCHFSGPDHTASNTFQALMQKVTKLGKEVMTLRKEANVKKNVVHSLAE